MRKKLDRQLYFEFPLESSRKVVREYQARYAAINEVLLENPRILDLAHKDFRKLSTRSDQAARNRNRRADYTSENIFRALIVHGVEQTDYRETTVRISESLCLQQFCRLGPREVMDYTFLCKAFGVLSPETLRAMNLALATYAVDHELLDPSTVRTDTTVVETNIHYPTDGSLLWDCARVLIRLLRKGRTYAPERLNNRFHDRKLKRLFVAIARGCRNQGKGKRTGKKAKIAKRKIKKYFRKLIAGVQRLIDIAEPFAAFAVRALDLSLMAVGYALEALVPDVKKVISQSVRAQLNGETVPAKERIFSIFEPHTELIARGKARKPVEFGHKILLTEAKGTFITDYEVLLASPNDRNLAPEVVERHENLYGDPPDVVAGDAGFSPSEDKRKELEDKVDVVAIPRNVADRMKEELAPWHRFRAGVEGTISVLKRAFRLFRCVYRGFNNFATNVGMGILCHNLVLLARLRR
jgi:IS5 family transposase